MRSDNALTSVGSVPYHKHLSEGWRVARMECEIGAVVSAFAHKVTTEYWAFTKLYVICRAMNRPGHNRPLSVNRRNRITGPWQRRFSDYFAVSTSTALQSLPMGCSWYMCRATSCGASAPCTCAMTNFFSFLAISVGVARASGNWHIL